MSLKYDLMSELLKPSSTRRFQASKSYHSPEGYKLSHHGTWRLTHDNKLMLTESFAGFWDIVNMTEFHTFECIDTIDEIDTLSDFLPEDIDKNFVPSLGIDWESPAVYI